MQIDVAELRQIEHPLRNNAAIADHDDRIGISLLQVCAQLFVVLDLFRLVDRQTGFFSRPLHRRCDKLESAALRAIRLSDYQADSERLGKLLQSGDRKSRSAAKNQI